MRKGGHHDLIFIVMSGAVVAIPDLPGQVCVDLVELGIQRLTQSHVSGHTHFYRSGGKVSVIRSIQTQILCRIDHRSGRKGIIRLDAGIKDRLEVDGGHILLHLYIRDDPLQRSCAVPIFRLGKGDLTGRIAHAPDGLAVFLQRIAVCDGSGQAGHRIFLIGATVHAGARHVDQALGQRVHNRHSGGAVPRHPLLYLHGGVQAEIHCILTVVQIK